MPIPASTKLADLVYILRRKKVTAPPFGALLLAPDAVALCLNSLPAKFDDRIRRCPLDLGSQIRVGWFSTLRCSIQETARDRDLVKINH